MGLLFHERRWGVSKDGVSMGRLAWSFPFCLFLECARLLPPNKGYLHDFFKHYLPMYP